jgi:uncharacterized repeat protein (TIGR03803 family)
MSALARFFGLVLGLAAVAAGPPAHATTFTTLHSFTGADGANPVAGLVFDTKGALYGTTSAGGGPANSGTVFKLNPATQYLTTLHAFTGPDGANPVAGLVFDAAGALYGTTYHGGAANDGTVFKLDPATKTLTTLYVFNGSGVSGSNVFPNAALVFDTTGALYGTTHGVSGGTVFKLDPATKVLTTLYHFFIFSFRHIFIEPIPYGVVFDTTGALYGTTNVGGFYGPFYYTRQYVGTVFKLDPATQVLATLHVFTGGADGGLPYARLVFENGALCGTTSSGGAHGQGTVFKLDPTTQVLTTLHAFTGADGANPQAGLVFDTTGALYGTTSAGGFSNLGTVFKLVP